MYVLVAYNKNTATINNVQHIGTIKYKLHTDRTFFVEVNKLANTFRKIYKKTGSSGSSSDYTLVGNVGVNGVELDIMKGATNSSDGEIGLVPKPTSSDIKMVFAGQSFLGSNF